MTAQFAEQLQHNEQSLSLCAYPLTGYLLQRNSAVRFTETSTACWRGYVGNWAVRERRLYLTGLDGTLSDGRVANLQTLFPDYPEGVFAHWYSGEARCTRGKLLKYRHRGFASTYEEDIFLTFEQGQLIHERIVCNGIAPEGETREGNVVMGLTTFPARLS